MMTRADAYAAGYAEGSRWAEGDIRAGLGSQEDVFIWLNEGANAWDVGARRGYRNTWARWDAGELTWEMLEHAPIGR